MLEGLWSRERTSGKKKGNPNKTWTRMIKDVLILVQQLCECTILVLDINKRENWV
jgi:hypothetical protein